MSKKKVLLVTQYFLPEDFKSNDLAFSLAEKNYDVTVLTGIPNYPGGHFFKNYGVFKKRIEIINNVKIYRSFLIPRGNSSGFRLVLNYFSWAFFASIWAIYLAIFKKFDLIIVHQPSPITQGIPAIIVKKIQRIPLYFWVLDLWPESLESVGGIKNPYIISFFLGLTKFIYRNSSKILISSRGFENSIVEKGVSRNKIIYFPNWAEDVLQGENEENDLPNLPTGFSVMFAGNIGESQDFNNIMKVAHILKNDDVFFLIIGDGRKKSWAESFAKKEKLNNIYFLGRFPLNTMSYFFKHASIMLISLKDEKLFNVTVPAKLQAYMVASKPIVGMINGEAAYIIEEAKCGIAVPAGDFNALAEAIVKMKHMTTEELNDLSLNSYSYYQTFFNKEKCLANLIQIIETDIK